MRSLPADREVGNRGGPGEKGNPAGSAGDAQGICRRPSPGTERARSLRSVGCARTSKSSMPPPPLPLPSENSFEWLS
jgi:hypothetical protein